MATTVWRQNARKRRARVGGRGVQWRLIDSGLANVLPRSKPRSVHRPPPPLPPTRRQQPRTRYLFAPSRRVIEEERESTVVEEEDLGLLGVSWVGVRRFVSRRS